MHNAVFNVVDEYQEEDGTKDGALRNTTYDGSEEGQVTVNNNDLFPVRYKNYTNHKLESVTRCILQLLVKCLHLHVYYNNISCMIIITDVGR